MAPPLTPEQRASLSSDVVRELVACEHLRAIEVHDVAWCMPCGAMRLGNGPWHRPTSLERLRSIFDP